MGPPGGPVSSIQMEVDVDHHLYGYRMTLVHGGSEFVLANSLDSFLIEPHAEVLGDVDILGVAVCIDHELKADGALKISLPRLVGKFGLNRVDDSRCAHASSNAHEAATVTATAARTGPKAMS